jgi:hypothetical protein
VIRPFRRFRRLPPAMFYAIISNFLLKIWWGYTYKTNETKIKPYTVHGVFSTLLFPHLFEGAIRV